MWLGIFASQGWRSTVFLYRDTPCFLVARTFCDFNMWKCPGHNTIHAFPPQKSIKQSIWYWILSVWVFSRAVYVIFGWPFGSMGLFYSKWITEYFVNALNFIYHKTPTVSFTFTTCYFSGFFFFALNIFYMFCFYVRVIYILLY